VKQSIVYLGYNSFRSHKRGVENVIDFQSQAASFNKKYYLHWGDNTSAYKCNRLICISIKHKWYWPFVLNLILRCIRRKSDFILHSHNPLFSIFSLFRTKVFTVHDGLYYQNKCKKRKMIIVFWLLEKILYSRCELIHFVSAFSKVKSLFGKRSNYIIIHNTSHFEHSVSICRKEPGSIKSVLVVRSIEERARIDILINTAEQFVDSEYIFTIAGKGPLLEKFRSKIVQKNLTNIKMLGYVDDKELLALYARCDIVLVIAEYGEGFGLPIIEGYLNNKPVVGTNCCAIPEIIISPDFLFENKPENIMRSLEYAGNHLNDDYRQYYNKRFSNSVILNQYRYLYKAVKAC
jgi:glycosyltransferase involved in cell wall biosynthesis